VIGAGIIIEEEEPDQVNGKRDPDFEWADLREGLVQDGIDLIGRDALAISGEQLEAGEHPKLEDWPYIISGYCRRIDRGKIKSGKHAGRGDEPAGKTDQEGMESSDVRRQEIYDGFDQADEDATRESGEGGSNRQILGDDRRSTPARVAALRGGKEKEKKKGRQSQWGRGLRVANKRMRSW